VPILGGFASECRAIKSLDIDLMKTPVNDETSSRSASSNIQIRWPTADVETSSSTIDNAESNAPITTLCGNILVHRVPSDTLDVVIMFGYFADAHTW